MADILENMVSDATEPEWLEKPVLGNIRAWQVIFLALGAVTAIIVVLCCCIRFRVPRTKQQIEADYKRRKITNKFRQKLQKIQDAKMDTLSLKDALVLLHSEVHLPMEDERGGDSQRSSILSPQQNSMEAYAPDGSQKPEPQMSGPNFAKLASKVATLTKLTQNKSVQPSSPSPSNTTKMDF